ncbi:MAG: SBBP repeat-containing protein [Candidatus Angelobacter sp.]
MDHDGHAFVIGFTDARDFPTTAGSAQPVAPGKPNPFATHAFVSEVSSSGSHLVYSTYLGGSSGEMGRAIALDSEGNAFVTGDTSSQDFPVKNAFQTHCPVPFGACNAAFVAKLNTNGRLVYSTYLSGTGGELSGGIAATPGGQAYVTGSALEGFPTTENAFQRVFVGPRDVFLTKFSSGGKLIFSSYLGGNEEEGSPVVALDRDTNAYLTGHIIFEIDSPEVSFPVTPGALQTTFGGGASDAFVAKVVALCALSTVNRTVTICSPGNGSTVKSPVNIVAGTTDVKPVKLTQVYLDGKKIYETPLSAINVNLPIAGGTHRLTVQALDTASVFFKKTISVTVSPH